MKRIITGMIIATASFVVAARAQLTLSGITTYGATNLVVNGINGLSGATYYVLMSTNLTLPLTQWTPVATNVLNASGNFTITVTNTVTPSYIGQRFYSLEAPQCILYNGLFYPTSVVTEESSGFFTATVSAGGEFEGALFIDGNSYPLGGAFDVSGDAEIIVPRGGLSPLTVALARDLNFPDNGISGSVSNGQYGWVSTLITDRAAARATNLSGQYTMLIPPIIGFSGEPPGYGYALITNNAGIVTIVGALGDGTPFSQTVPISPDGWFPLYANPYGNTGLLLGWISVTNDSLTGELEWIKKQSGLAGLYPYGFTNLITLIGARWIKPPPNTPAIALATGQLNISGGDLVAPLSFPLAISNTNLLVKLPGGPTNSLTGSINPNTGFLNLSFENGGKTIIGSGAVLQSSTNAAGYFLGTNQSGAFIITPQ